MLPKKYDYIFYAYYLLIFIFEINKYHHILTIRLNWGFGKKAFQDSFPDFHFDIFDIFKNVNFIKTASRICQKKWL
jgi:hypothetical protein